ncbi:hypothetical protein LSH36_1077g00005 [Paralvinella palmiformis]|uniref:Uncharacterized protein n=1 Tax=Paralvinella palmiformis TaxID=53620 RepID=A0AAD9IV58_9ANNE|nr:hypothetical protein LSH36_1077g00005 [Paralvinella palmiformis]
MLWQTSRSHHTQTVSGNEAIPYGLMSLYLLERTPPGYSEWDYFVVRSIASAWSIILSSSHAVGLDNRLVAVTPGDESVCAGLVTPVLVFEGGLHTLGEWGVSSGATNGVVSLIFNGLKPDRFGGERNGGDKGANKINGANEADGVDGANVIKGIVSYLLFVILALLIIRILNRQNNSLIGFSYRKQMRPAEKWQLDRIPTYLQNASQFDSKLVQYIREKWLLPPFTGNLNLVHPEKKHYSQRSQSKFIDDLLRGKSNGFYIECGAAGGDSLFNSLFFEKSRNWSGLLVEANPISISPLLKKRRHAYIINVCLSPKRKLIIVPFTQARLIGGLPDYMEQSHKKRIHITYTQTNTTNV